MAKTRKKNMVMTNEDIVRSWREAKDRRAQIKILAELNVCPQELIIQILKESGVDPRQLPRERKKKEDAPVSVEAMDAVSEELGAVPAVNEPEVVGASGEAEGAAEACGDASAESVNIVIGDPPRGIVEEALNFFRRDLVRTVTNLRKEYDVLEKKYTDKIAEIDCALCGVKKV